MRKAPVKKNIQEYLKVRFSNNVYKVSKNGATRSIRKGGKMLEIS